MKTMDVSIGGCWGELNCNFCGKRRRWAKGAKVFDGDGDVQMQICEDCMLKENLQTEEAIESYCETLPPKPQQNES